MERKIAALEMDFRKEFGPSIGLVDTLQLLMKENSLIQIIKEFKSLSTNLDFLVNYSLTKICRKY